MTRGIDDIRQEARNFIADILTNTPAQFFVEDFRQAVKGLKMTFEGRPVAVRLDEKDASRLPKADDGRGWDKWEEEYFYGPNWKFNQAWAKRAMLRAVEIGVIRAFQRD